MLGVNPGRALWIITSLTYSAKFTFSAGERRYVPEKQQTTISRRLRLIRTAQDVQFGLAALEHLLQALEQRWWITALRRNCCCILHCFTIFEFLSSWVLWSIHFLSVGRVAGGLEPIPSGERRGSPWTGRQSITLTPKDSLESPVNLSACFWMVGGTRRTRREPTHTRGEHAASTQTEPAGIRTWNPLLWGDGADHHTTVQPSFVILNQFGKFDCKKGKKFNQYY